MNWFESIDIYCERTSAHFWAEPVNALTNIAFILAAIFAYYIAKKNNRLDFVNLLLIFLTTSVGVGSFLFHTFANNWSQYADLIPIALLAIFFIAFSTRRFFNKSWPQVAIVGLGFFIASAILLYLIAPLAQEGKILSSLNKSHIYAPVLLGLIFLSLMLSKANHKGAKLLWLGSGVFFTALIFRSIDMAICQSFPLGTHFLWHSLNGLLIAILLLSIIKYGEYNEN